MIGTDGRAEKLCPGTNSVLGFRLGQIRKFQGQCFHLRQELQICPARHLLQVAPKVRRVRAWLFRRADQSDQGAPGLETTWQPRLDPFNEIDWHFLGGTNRHDEQIRLIRGVDRIHDQSASTKLTNLPPSAAGRALARELARKTRHQGGPFPGGLVLINSRNGQGVIGRWPGGFRPVRQTDAP